MATLDGTTIRDHYGPAMLIHTQTEADDYYQQLVAWQMGYKAAENAADGAVDCSRAEAEKVVKSNLGYVAGYYDAETRERVERLYHCAHPVLGAIAEHGQPTPDQALEMGRRMGERYLEEHLHGGSTR